VGVALLDGYGLRTHPSSFDNVGDMLSRLGHNQLGLADHILCGGKNAFGDPFHLLSGFTRAILQRLGDWVDPLPDGSRTIVILGIKREVLGLSVFVVAETTSMQNSLP
jgi:hypothetical protein